VTDDEDGVDEGTCESQRMQVAASCSSRPLLTRSIASSAKARVPTINLKLKPRSKMTEREPFGNNELVVGRTPPPIANPAECRNTVGLNPMDTSIQVTHNDNGMSRESATQGSDARLAGRVEFTSGLGHHVSESSHSHRDGRRTQKTSQNITRRADFAQAGYHPVSARQLNIDTYNQAMDAGSVSSLSDRNRHEQQTYAAADIDNHIPS
jgi:hypothetical protein